MRSWYHYFPISQYISLALILGVLAASCVSISLAPIIALGIISITSLSCNDYKIWLVLTFCFMLGFLNYQIQDSLYNISVKKLGRSYFYGEVTISSIDQTTNKNFPTKITVLHKNNGEKNERFWILCKNHGDEAIGDSIFLNGVHFSIPENEHIRQWMKKENITASAFVHDLTVATKTRFKKQIQENNLVENITHWFEKAKHNIRERLSQKLSTEANELIGLIFLGTPNSTNAENTTEIRSTFMNWGLSHYLARAGLHFTLLFSLLNMLFSLLLLPYTMRKTLLLSTCFFYTMLSWPSITFLRALLSASTCIVADLKYMQTSGLHIINLICFLLLLWNPSYLFALDFQLSFFLTYLIILGNHTSRLRPTTIPS